MSSNTSTICITSQFHSNIETDEVMFPITSHFVIHSNYHILLIATHSTTLGEPDQQTIADEVVIIKHMKVELARWWLGRGGVQTDDGRAVEVVGGDEDDGGRRGGGG